MLNDLMRLKLRLAMAIARQSKRSRGSPENHARISAMKSRNPPTRPRAERFCGSIQAFVRSRPRPWKGTATQLLRALKAEGAEVTFAPARFSIWLRRHEPVLWWNYGVAVEFGRTAKRRVIRLSLRKELQSRRFRAETGAMTAGLGEVAVRGECRELGAGGR